MENNSEGLKQQSEKENVIEEVLQEGGRFEKGMTKLQKEIKKMGGMENIAKKITQDSQKLAELKRSLKDAFVIGGGLGVTGTVLGGIGSGAYLTLAQLDSFLMGTGYLPFDQILLSLGMSGATGVGLSLPLVGPVIKDSIQLIRTKGQLSHLQKLQKKATP
ncbi:MAG TPA: hypothetical protein VJH96_00600 [Patescibacteria group bacterium]|nr:hypothetical protein [Patescibacteria group bacterium]